MMKTEREVGIDLIQLALALLNNIKYIIAVALVMGMIGCAVSATLITPIYQASAKMIVNTRYDENQIVTNDQLNSAKSLVDTYAVIIRSRDVLNIVINDLELEESYNQLLNCVSVKAVNNTQIMQVVVQHKDREVALAIAGKILEIAPDVIVETVEAGSVKPVEQEYADSKPISPNILKNTALMALVGFVLTCAVIVVVFLTDNTYKSDLDIQNDLELPVLGVLPTVESCKSRHYKYGYSRKGSK